jgi:hypothetical protein
MGNRDRVLLRGLPVGEANPVMRLHQVSHAMRGHKETGQGVGRGRADQPCRLRAADPALARRPVGSGLSRRMFNWS